MRHVPQRRLVASSVPFSWSCSARRDIDIEFCLVDLTFLFEVDIDRPAEGGASPVGAARLLEDEDTARVAKIREELDGSFMFEESEPTGCRCMRLEQ